MNAAALLRHLPALAILLLASSNGSSAQAPPGTAPTAPSNTTAKLPQKASNKPLRILFLGNSLTAMSFMPWMVHEFVRASGRPCDIEMLAFPGETLEGHYHTVKTKMALTSGNWDCIVLQEASEIRLEPRRAAQYAHLLTEAVKAKDLSRKAETPTKILFFEAFADKGQTKHQEEIRLTTEAICRQTGATLVPVGELFAANLKEKPALNPYMSDNHHPSASGSYLAACAIYRAIMGAKYKALKASLPGKIAYVCQANDPYIPATESGQAPPPGTSFTLVELKKADATYLQNLAETQPKSQF
ncbi:MAG: hypothetical protein SFV17_27885 [Candidatus Obscuribacter sp.]|nr:hypothetical protein [Candidatus Obscuribacter sp.]